MAYPSNSDDGFYHPDALRYKDLESYQSWINSTKGQLSIQDKDAIHNLIKQLPILRAEELELAGEQVVWLRRLTFGKRCTYFNELSDQCAVDKCAICFGTSYMGGFAIPIQLKMSFVPGKVDVNIEQAGLTIVQRPQAHTIITNPIMSEKDIIVTFSNERYEIHTAEAIEHQGYRHYQELTLSRIDKTDEKYLIPVPGMYGQTHEDFMASIMITPPIGQGGTMPGANFPASIMIRNFYFEPNNGLTD